ncbi:histone-lysine N-methyltransferase SETMAR-like [Glossina fuscipes]|uniref:Histone-lysine N-methyltransferase SETMAR-like n=1 Tax=Glossina fuscipes TaxID=7396 RepID=A0A9C5Z723_9MUSC|nr:histone-lysine N-methyltransferase SETMAR-like [Glossina fuscipes]
MADFVPSESHVRNCVHFHFNADVSATETTSKICDIYGDVLKFSKCQRWFRRFAVSDYDLSYKHRTGRPGQFDNDALKSLVESDPRLTIQELARSLGSTWSTVQRHLKEIGKVHRQGKWLQNLLSEANKDLRRTICNSMLTRLSRDPFLLRIVTGDEKWILYDNIKRLKQWLSANERPLPTHKQSLSLRKVLLCIWWDYSGIVHYELLKPGETVTVDNGYNPHS